MGDHQPLARHGTLRAPAGWIVLGFVATATANTWGLFGDAGVFIAELGRLLIVGVVVAVGLTLQLKRLRGVGRQLFTTGLMATVAVAAASLALISLLTLTD